MMTFKIGDKVILKPGLRFDGDNELSQQEPSFPDMMQSFYHANQGKIFTVNHSSGRSVRFIEKDNRNPSIMETGGWNWHENWILLASSREATKIKLPEDLFEL